MAVVTILNDNRKLTAPGEIAAALSAHGIDYERWAPSHVIADDAPAAEILNAYSEEIDALKKRGGYVTADVIDVNPTTAGLEEMLAKFSREHWHDEDEVRFIIAGRGLFHIHTRGSQVLAIEVEAGDLIRVPGGTLHWFNLCADRRIRAIRLFQNQAGWTPHYSESRIDANFLPVCFGGANLSITK